MNGYLDHWSDPHPSFYNPIGGNDHHTQSGGIDYDNTPLAAGFAKNGFLTPTMGTDCPFGDFSYEHYASGDMPTNPRQQLTQHLYIDTQLNHYQVNDSDNSTASSSSLSRALASPPVQLYSGLQPSVHIPSPHSAPGEGRAMLMDFEAISPIAASASPHYPPEFRGDNTFEFPIPLVSTESDVATQVPLPHILEWKRVIEQCGTNDFVPQTVYQPYTEADRKRYIRDVELHETLFFQSDDTSELGVSLDDALKQRLRHLKDKDDRMFVGCGPSVSIRLQWPGYAPWSKQIPTMDFKNPKGPITRAKLAKNIATCIRRFAEHVQDKPMEADSDGRWRVGPRHIKVEDLILVSLHHVSKGSWQPQLRFRAPFPTPSYQWSEPLPMIPTS